MRQNLNRRIGYVAGTWYTKLCTYIVCAGNSCISRKGDLAEVLPLTSQVLNKCGCIEIGLWDGDIKDTITRGYINRDGQIGTLFRS